MEKTRRKKPSKSETFLTKVNNLSFVHNYIKQLNNEQVIYLIHKNKAYEKVHLCCRR